MLPIPLLSAFYLGLGLSQVSTVLAPEPVPPIEQSPMPQTIVPTLSPFSDPGLGTIAPHRATTSPRPSGSPNPLAQVDQPQPQVSQTDPNSTYEQLFVPQHRNQPGRTPCVPKDLPLNSDTPEDDTPASPTSAGSPSSTIGIPSAYGASWRSFGVGLGVQSRARFTNRADGGTGVGTGFGSPETIGLQVGISFVDVSDPLADGSVSLKLHRQLPYDVAIAVGATGVLTWGGPDGGSSIYGVASKRFTLGDVGQPLSQITTSFGLGSGQFRSESQINRDVNAVGAFGSVSLRVIEPVSAIVEWTGQDLNLGVSVVPFRSIPLVLTPAVSDVTGRAGDGPRFIAGIGYGTRF